MRINKDKPIGRVLYIVEGSRTEFVLLRKIFCDVLKYEYVEKRRNRFDGFRSKNNSHSTVAVINTSDSNIKDISDDSYLNNVFDYLINIYGFPVDKSAIYYLFDRDPASNTKPEIIKKYISELKDPYDNNDCMKAGLLLLSYPSIESYMISSFQEDANVIEIKFGADAKSYIGQHTEIQTNKISDQSIIHATNEFIKYLAKLDIEWDVDDFSCASSKVFDAEEVSYNDKGVYNVFSMLTLSLIQMGIIEL